MMRFIPKRATISLERYRLGIPFFFLRTSFLIHCVVGISCSLQSSGNSQINYTTKVRMRSVTGVFFPGTGSDKKCGCIGLVRKREMGKKRQVPLAATRTNKKPAKGIHGFLL
jgi:hypothetical protein